VSGERQQNDKSRDADSRSFCDHRICSTFDVRKYTQQLRQMLPYVPPIDLTSLKRLHEARDHKGIIKLVKRLMNIEAVTFQVFWVPDGAASDSGLKDAPAWVKLPSNMPFYGSEEFKEMTIEMFFRRSFFQQAYDQAVLAVAHEFSHVVLESIWHPLRKCEKAVDMTAMILGFGQLYEATYNKINIKTLGYLTRERKCSRPIKYWQESISAPPDRLWIGSGNYWIEFAHILVESGMRSFMYTASAHT
jgi:hypothetical protein